MPKPAWEMKDNRPENFHVYPNRDEIEHDITPFGVCACQPRLEYAHPKTGKKYQCVLVVHRAIDCREMVEEAEEIKTQVENKL